MLSKFDNCILRWKYAYVDKSVLRRKKKIAFHEIFYGPIAVVGIFVLEGIAPYNLFVLPGSERDHLAKVYILISIVILSTNCRDFEMDTVCPYPSP